MPSPKTPTKATARAATAKSSSASKGGTATKARTTPARKIGGGSGLANFPQGKGGGTVTVNQILLTQGVGWTAQIQAELNQMGAAIAEGNRFQAGVHGKRAYAHLQQLETMMQKVAVYARQQT